MLGFLLQMGGGGLHDVGQWSFVGILIGVVVVAALIALVYVALRQFGITIPPFLITVLWIVIVAVVVIFAIKLVAGLW